jgi:hypothetical protein
MTSRLLASAALLVLCACFSDRDFQVRTISLDHLTVAQANELAVPYLSKDGTVFSSKELSNSITIRDHERNVNRIRSMLSARDASPSSVALHFQLIRATESGGIGEGLDRVAEALGELLRFRGYELLSEAVVSASERGMVEQSLDGGGIPLQLSVHVADVRGSDNRGSVELKVDLRRPGGQLLATNVVVPMGQTVMLGTAYPGTSEGALILTVRGEMGSELLRKSSPRRRVGVDVGIDEAQIRAHVEEAVAAEAAIGVGIGTPATRVIVAPAHRDARPRDLPRKVPARTPAAVPPPSH